MIGNRFGTLTTAVLEHRDPVTNVIVAYSASLGWYRPGEFMTCRIVRPSTHEGWANEEDARAMCSTLWDHLFKEQPIYGIA